MSKRREGLRYIIQYKNGSAIAVRVPQNFKAAFSKSDVDKLIKQHNKRLAEGR